jgi:hypothetical protein
MAAENRPTLRRTRDPGSGTVVFPPGAVEISAKVGDFPDSSRENTSVDGTAAHEGSVDRPIVTRLLPEPSVLVPSVKHAALGVSVMQYSPETLEKHVRRATPGNSEPVPRLTLDPRFTVI